MKRYLLEVAGIPNADRARNVESRMARLGWTIPAALDLFWKLDLVQNGACSTNFFQLVT